MVEEKKVKHTHIAQTLKGEGKGWFSKFRKVWGGSDNDYDREWKKNCENAPLLPTVPIGREDRTAAAQPGLWMWPATSPGTPTGLFAGLKPLLSDSCSLPFL